MTSAGTAIFRCDAAPDIGSGHVYRCLTLADAMIERGWECHFFGVAGTDHVVPALRNEPYHFTSLSSQFVLPEFSAGKKAKAEPADLLILDHYGLNAEFEKQMRFKAKRIVVLDDLADRMHECDVLIDQTHGRDRKDYRPYVPLHCVVLTGANYALVRPQFAAKRRESLARRTQVPPKPRVLVSLGSTNMHDITGRVMEALETFSAKALHVDVVLGAHAPGAKNVKKIVERIAHGNFHKLKYHENVQDMAALMAQADVAIGAGGTTSWERCCLGLPTLMIEIADNQRVIAENLHKAGAVKNMGRVEGLDTKAIKNGLESLLTAPKQLIKMSESAAAICDGKGVERVARILNHESAGMVA